MNINKVHTGHAEPLVNTVKDSSPAARSAVSTGTSRNGQESELRDLSSRNLRDLADTLNIAARSMNKRISFSFNDKIDRVVLKVINTDNNQVIREIPPKEMVRVYEHIHELIGMFVDESR